MNISIHFYRDVMTGLFLVTGISTLIAGQLVLATLLFGAAALASNLDLVKPVRARA